MLLLLIIFAFPSTFGSKGILHAVIYLKGEAVTTALTDIDGTFEEVLKRVEGSKYS